jgi:hypothetical protein
MNTLENRVRAATRAAADTVAPDSVPPLLLSPVDPARPRRGSRSSASVWARRLAPLGAALAVVALAVAMVNLSQAVRHPSASPRPAPSAYVAVTAGPPAASYVAAGLVPRYYVSIETHGNSRLNPVSYAVVRSTATGSALGTVLPPAADGTIVGASAAADDKTFVLAEQPWASPQSRADQQTEPCTFYLFRLGASGHPGALTRLPMSLPGGALMIGFALSPDGRQLAIAVQPNNVKAEPGLQQIRLYSLGTGAVRTWSAGGIIDAGPDDNPSLSWTADGRTLAFDWQANGDGAQLGVRLLNLRAGGTNLLADSRQAVSLVNRGPGGGTASSLSGAGPQPTCQEDSVITPDGTTIVCGAITAIKSSVAPAAGGGAGPQSPPRGARTEFLEYSTVTGSVTRILGHWTFGNVGVLAVDVLWSNASGSVLIGVIPDAGVGRVGVIRGNEFTPLRTSPDSVLPYANTW